MIQFRHPWRWKLCFFSWLTWSKLNVWWHLCACSCVRTWQLRAGCPGKPARTPELREKEQKRSWWIFIPHKHWELQPLGFTFPFLRLGGFARHRSDPIGLFSVPISVSICVLLFILIVFPLQINSFFTRRHRSEAVARSVTDCGYFRSASLTVF